MKTFTFLSALIFSMSAWAVDIQKSQCLGDPNDPVAAIYLHGWFSPSGQGGEFGGFERANRKQLAELASRLRIRIAVPVAPNTAHVGGKTVRAWVLGSLSSAEKISKSVCGELSSPRTLIGFSNGAYKALSVAASCGVTGNHESEHIAENYSLIVASGAQPSRPKGLNDRHCPRLLIGLAAAEKGWVHQANSVIRDYKDRHAQAELTKFPGEHGIPPNKVLEAAMRPLLQSQIELTSQAPSSSTSK